MTTPTAQNPADSTPTPLDLKPRSRLRTLSQLQIFGLLLVILVLGGYLGVYGHFDAMGRRGQSNTFLNLDNLVTDVITPMSYYAIMAVGMTFVIVTGGIDISVGSTMALSAIGSAMVLQHFAPDAPAWEVLPVAFALSLGIGLVCGLVNGILIISLRLHPFIVTLGTLAIYRGIASNVPGRYEKTVPVVGRSLPDAFSTNFMRWHVMHLRPMPMIITIIVVSLGWFFLSQTISGRETYAVGGNAEAARFSGLRTGIILLRAYAIAGLTAGIAALVSLGNFGSTTTATATGYELMVIAAAVVGGASLTGGRGSAIGALLGALIIAMINDGIIILHYPSEYQLIIVGSAIIIAAALDNYSQYLRVRRLARARSV